MDQILIPTKSFDFINNSKTRPSPNLKTFIKMEDKSSITKKKGRQVNQIK